MSRIHRTPQPRSLAKKPAAKAAAAAPTPKHQPTKRVAQDIARLSKSKRATETKTEDGSTRELTTRRKGTTTTSRLEQREGKLLDSTFEYSRTTSKAGLERNTSFSSNTDMLGRRTSEAKTQTSRELANGSDVKTSTKGTDAYGNVKYTTEHSKDLSLDNGTLHTESRLARDSRGNRITSSSERRVEQQGKSVVTTDTSREKGSELDVRTGTSWENKVFRVQDGVDFRKTNSIGRGYLREAEVDASKVVAKADKFGNGVDKVLGWLDLEPAEWKSEVPADRMHEKTFHQGDNTYVGARYGVSGGQSVAFDGKGVNATFNREATAGVSANASGSAKGRFGEASYDAYARAEATASVNADARLDSNGLTATAGAKAGVYVEAQAHGTARTPGLKLGNTEFYAAVEGTAKASAMVQAEATGNVSITRHPPTAVVSGTAGVSAVAKVEGELRASAGPFTIVGSAYASAGAEAKATGILGYEDGKLKIGGSIGAALGVGAGAGVTLEVDVAQIGQMAKDAADVNHDGKLDIHDAFAAAGKVAGWFGFGAPHKESVRPQALRIAPGGVQVGAQQYQYRPYLMPQWATAGFVSQHKQ